MSRKRAVSPAIRCSAYPLDEFIAMHNNASMNAPIANAGNNLNLVRSRGAPG
jgi:hypothetical protein